MGTLSLSLTIPLSILTDILFHEVSIVSFLVYCDSVWPLVAFLQWKSDSKKVNSDASALDRGTYNFRSSSNLLESIILLFV